MKVIMLNRDWGYGIQTRMLQGFSGKSYGQSRWNAKYNCHTVELTLEQYDKCRDDVHRAVHLVCRRWYPVFEVPLPVAEFAAGFDLGMDMKHLPEDPSDSFKAGWEIVQRPKNAPDFGPETYLVEQVRADDPLPEVNASMPFMKLRSIAKAEGCWIEGMKNTALAEAINTKRALSLPVVAPTEVAKAIIPVEDTPDYKSGYMAAAQGMPPPHGDPSVTNNWLLGYSDMQKKSNRFISPSARFSAPAHA